MQTVKALEQGGRALVGGDQASGGGDGYDPAVVAAAIGMVFPATLD